LFSSTAGLAINSSTGIVDMPASNAGSYSVKFVTLSNLVIAEGAIRLVSVDGKLIEAREFNNSTFEHFNVESLKAGIYYFQIGSTTEKVVIR